MTLPVWKTRDCDCTVEIGCGQKRPRTCEHGGIFEKVREDGSTVSKRRSEPDRDWTDARAKVDHEGCCRICKRSDVVLEAAHVMGRAYDEPKVNRTTGEILQKLYVDPDRIFPACGPSPGGCHGEAERKEINVLEHLTLEEQVRAVKDAGGIGLAFRELAPVDHRREVEETAYKPESLKEGTR